MKRVLITGGAGFIGSHLCERLLARGDEVLCVDNFFTSRRQNIAHLRDNPLFEFMRHDITWPLYVEVDRIYNLACPASPVHYQFDPVQTTKTSVHGAINMLGLAKRLKVRILQASTSEVYGDPAQHPQTESYWGNVNPIGPRACYDAETEILTEDGWVPFPSLRQDTAVATLTEAGEIEYHVPDEVISYPYVGELLRFANSKYDFTVTPNHRMYVRSKTGKLRFLRADEDRHWPAWKVPTGADFQGGEIEWFELGPPPPDAKVQVDRIRMDDWLEFLGYYISEGCVHVRQRVREVNGRDYEVRDFNVLIAQAEGDSRDRMIGCLNRLGFKFFTSDDHQLRICSKQLAEILAPFGKAGDKYIPREFLGLSRRQSMILLDALILGDGSRRGDSVCYWTKSGRLADDVQELALRCGYAASKSLTPGRDIYRVNLRPPVEANLVEPERLRYAGKVYCVDVKNHVICVRRHGRAAFCGNCYDEGEALRGDALLRLSSPAQTADPRDPDLQHVRPADAPQRRPRGVELHRPGAEGGADHAVRNGEPVALLLLRGRPCHRDDRDDGPGRAGRAGEPGQPRRVHDPRAGDDGQGAHRLEVGDRFPAASTRRPGPPPPGHHPGEGEASLGADDPAARRPHPHRRLLPGAARRGVMARLYRR